MIHLKISPNLVEKILTDKNHIKSCMISNGLPENVRLIDAWIDPMDNMLQLKFDDGNKKETILNPLVQSYPCVIFWKEILTKDRIYESAENQLIDCPYYRFFDSISCLLVEGPEFYPPEVLYRAIKREWESTRKELK